ncbi:hypothetical protein AAVH_24113 [Aphelenchoides avenae]|nr:hypothetical protein AAVH_24113 [Aphelenchus avenae]
MSICKTFHDCFPLDELSEGALEDLQDEMTRMFDVQRFSVLAKSAKNRTNALTKEVKRMKNAEPSELPELLRDLKGNLPKLKRVDGRDVVVSGHVAEEPAEEWSKLAGCDRINVYYAKRDHEGRNLLFFTIGDLDCPKGTYWPAETYIHCNTEDGAEIASNTCFNVFAHNGIWTTDANTSIYVCIDNIQPPYRVTVEISPLDENFDALLAIYNTLPQIISLRQKLGLAEKQVLALKQQNEVAANSENAEIASPNLSDTSSTSKFPDVQHECGPAEFMESEDRSLLYELGSAHKDPASPVAPKRRLSCKGFQMNDDRQGSSTESEASEHSEDIAPGAAAEGGVNIEHAV